ncbi:MAG TPA: nitroreductase/quinone reductase family protein [Myxococcota bacterium]|nr:nitroreductase/quinone reductase family protein [Myxococcota bacterium]
MKAVKLLAIALVAYLGVVVGFESLVAFMGRRQAEAGLEPGDEWIVITTTDANGSAKDTVVAGWESGGRLYVAANHWPRAWYRRAIAQPEVEIARGGRRSARRAVRVEGEERERVAREYGLPLAIRALTGFPPRAFLRLDPR